MQSNLDDRQKVVLESVVQTYVDTAAPVGSERVARESGLGFSSATIRNLMGSLEEMGLMMQPHTSAGRIPTDRGYRVYVDELMGPADLSREEQEIVIYGLDRAARRPDHLAGVVASVISQLSGQMGFASPPNLDEGIFQSLHGELLSDGRIALALTLDSGLVRSSVRRARPERIDRRTLADGIRDLNRRFSGLAVGEIRERIFGKEGEAHLPPTRVGRLFREAAEDLIESGGVSAISVSGFESLLLQPEFHDPSGLGPLTGLLQERGRLADAVGLSGARDDVEVRIGSENDGEELTQFSILVAPYRFGRFSGILGVIGPTRMPYNRTIALMEFIRRVVTSRVGAGNG